MDEQVGAMRTDSGYRFDEIDRQIVHVLMADTRNTSALMITEGVNVSIGTIRNCIKRLEKERTTTGYHAQINFKQNGGRLTHLFICNAPFENREAIVQQVQTLPGVINIRELRTGG